jgi:fermentation-respiration switch protein FrsA (DUF1100 family)
VQACDPSGLLCALYNRLRILRTHEEAYQLPGEPKELLIIPGAGHVDLYDRVRQITFGKIASFFTENL